MPDPSASSDKVRRVVLLIDEDPATARLVRLSLHGPQCQVVVAPRPAEGISIATRQRPDLILLEMAFRGKSGLEVAESLRERAETSNCAVAFLARETSVARRFKAIQFGAMDYLQKPMEGKRLGNTVDGIFKRLARGERPSAVTGPSVGKTLETLHQLEEDAATGSVFFNRPGESAHIHFSLGRVVEARYGGAAGDDALNAIAGLGDWQIVFREGRQPNIQTKPTNVGFDDTTDLSETDPQLPRMETKDEDLVETKADLPAFRAPVGGFAPEAALGTTSIDDDAEERTVVDPTHPLLDMDTNPVKSSDVVIRTSPDGRVGDPTIPTKSEPPAIATVTDAPIDLTATEEFVDDDESTPLQFAIDDSVPTAPGGPSAKGPVAVRVPAASAGLDAVPTAALDPLRRWLTEFNRAPLLLIIPNDKARLTLSRTAEQLGFRVLCAENGKEGYASAVKVRPVAVLTDLKIPDMDGRELVAAVRTDFMVRETPFLMVSGDQLAAKIAAIGDSAAMPIVKGLLTALLPRVQLYEQLKNEQSTTVEGRLEPIGTSTLLRSIGATRVTGLLRLTRGEDRNAEVHLGKGEIYGVTVNAPQSSVGPLALMHLIGYEWQDYSFERLDRLDENQVSMGSLGQQIETAAQRNNILLAQVYKLGVGIDDVEVDKPSLDSYLQTLAPDSIELLVRLVEGEAAVNLVAQGAAPNLLRSMVFDLRRRAVVRPVSLRAVRRETASAESVVPPVLPGPARRRWLVVAAAGFTTVILAAGGYLVWHYLQ